MREIKFRAWDKNIKEYRDVVFDTADYRFGFIIEHDGTLDSDVFIWEQYTGLKDKNGKEIYEGDIIECEYYPDLPTTKNNKLIWQGKVVYGGDASFYVYRMDKEGGIYAIRYGGSAIKRWEIIGNIHEGE